MRKENYQVLGHVYDELMDKSSIYESWENLINQAIEKYGIEKGNALDVACGTGTVSKMLLEKGFSLVGIDKSSEMLENAKKKLKRYGKKVKLLKKDMVNFKFSKKFDIVTCSFDSINYIISTRQLKNFFENVYKSLTPGGYFVFDTNTNEHINVLQKRDVQFFKIKEGFVVFVSGGKKNIWKLRIYIFLRENGKFSLTEEIHKERGYDSKEIQPLIKDVGFKLIEKKNEYKKHNGKRILSRQYYILTK